MKFLQMHQTIVKHDAIGNDISTMHQLLGRRYECAAYAENRLNGELAYVDDSQIAGLLKDEETVVIYHHSVYWEKGMDLLQKAKGKVIIRYHNVTPPEYFQPYNEHHFRQCSLGREQTGRLQREFPDAIWMPASAYNAQDLKETPEERIAVCPPFNRIAQWAAGTPDAKLLAELIDSPDINLLFVGRIAPNKGYLFLLDALHCFCVNYDRSVRFHFVGKFDEGLDGYNRLITNRIDTLELRQYVRFIGEINDATLMAYYLGCDLFVCASEHEGFCVPIPEAQYFGLPVIARGCAAVGETAGEDQVILGDDVREYAAAIHLITENREYYEFLQARGRQNYDNRFSTDRISQVFTDALKTKAGVEV